jgi:hypothetical protein
LVKIRPAKLLPSQDGDTADSHDPALEQLIRMYIVPASKRIRSIAIIAMVASEGLSDDRFFYNFLDRKVERMIDLEILLLSHNLLPEPEGAVLQIIDHYDEIERIMDHVMLLLPPDHERRLAYDEWKKEDKRFKLQLTVFSSKRGYEKLYNALQRRNWIVT